MDRNEHQLYSGEFGRRSDLQHFFIWNRAMKLQKIRGRKTDALNLLKSYGITTVPCFLWSNPFDDSSNLTSGADRLHQRNLGFPKRIQKAMIVDGSIFGGLVLRTKLNTYMSAIRLQGMSGLTKSCHLFDTAAMQAKERQVVMECTQYILFLAGARDDSFIEDLIDVVVEHNKLSHMVDLKHHTVDSIVQMNTQCIFFMDTAARVWDTIPSSLKRIFKSLNFPKFPNYHEYAREWMVVGNPHIMNDTEAFEMAGKAWHTAWEFNNKQLATYQSQCFLHESRRCARGLLCAGVASVNLNELM